MSRPPGGIPPHRPLPHGAAPPSTPVLVAIAAAMFGGCGSRDSGAAGEARIDTLSSGLVLVDNRGPGRRGVEPRVLRERLRIGGHEEGPERFSRIVGLAADAAGRVWVLDGIELQLRVFDREGTHLLTIAREGEGPGEFRSPIGLFPSRDGLVWAVDMSNQRYTAFDSTGRIVRERRRRVLGRSSNRGARENADGTFLEGGVGIWGRISLETVFALDSTMAPTDSLAVGLSLEETDERLFALPDDAPFVVFIPWSSRMLWTPAGPRQVWRALSREYAIARVTLDGDTARLVRRDAAAPPVTAPERDSVVARLDSLLDGRLGAQADRIPATKPYLRTLFTSPDGRLWAQRELAADETGTRFDVFDPEGRFLGALTAPVALRPPFAVAADRLYATTLDALDIPYVVVLEIPD